MKKIETINDLVPACYGKTIDEEAQLLKNGDCLINVSSIWTELIQCAGRYCERFASDLLVWYDSFNKALNDPNTLDYTEVFGFRESGVDHFNYVKNQYNKYGLMTEYYYRKLYILELHKDYDRNVITVKLWEAQR